MKSLVTDDCCAPSRASGESADPLALDGLAFRHGEQVRVLVASLVPARRRVVLEGLPRATLSLRRLNELTAPAALFELERFRASAEVVGTSSGSLTLELLPYEIARIDLGE